MVDDCIGEPLLDQIQRSGQTIPNYTRGHRRAHMAFRRLRPVPRQVRAAILVGAAVGLLSPALRSGAFAQTFGTDRWVGTWTTAEVGRPQTPPPNGPALA